MFDRFRGVWYALFFSALFFLAAMNDDGSFRPDKVWMAAGFSLLFVGVALWAVIVDWRNPAAPEQAPAPHREERDDD